MNPEVEKYEIEFQDARKGITRIESFPKFWLYSKYSEGEAWIQLGLQEHDPQKHLFGTAYSSH